MPTHPKDEYREIIEVVRQFAQRELAPIVDELDEKEAVAPDIFRKLASLDLLGITAPEQYGGAGLGAVAAAAVTEELGARTRGRCCSSWNP